MLKFMQIVFCVNKLIAKNVGAGLAPPGNKIFNYNTGRPRPIPTMSAICLVNHTAHIPHHTAKSKFALSFYQKILIVDKK